MSQESTPSIVSGKKPRRSLWRTLVRISLAFALLVLVPFLVFVLVLWIQERQGQQFLKQRLAERTANQKPIDEASLQARYRSQCSGTMASEWTTILQEIVALDLDKNRVMQEWMGARDMGLPTSQRPWKNEADMRKLAASLQPLIDRIRQTAAEDRQVEMPKFIPGHHQQMSLQRSRDIARLLALHCDLATIDRNSKEITESVLAGLGTARAFEGYPFPAISTVSTAIEGMQLFSLKTALERDLLEKSDLQRIAQRLLRRTPFSQLADNSIQNNAIVVLRGIEEGPFFLGFLLSDQRKGLFYPLLRSRDANFFLDQITRFEQLPMDDSWTWLQSVRRIVRDSTASSKLGYWQGIDKLVSQLTIPSIGEEASTITAREMRYQIAEYSIAVRLFEDDHGHLPLALEELSPYLSGKPVPQSSLDQTLGFRSTPESVLMWTFDPTNSFIDKLPDNPNDPELRRSFGVYYRWELRVGSLVEP